MVRLTLFCIVGVAIAIIALIFANIDGTVFRSGGAEVLLSRPPVQVVLQGVLIALGIFFAAFHQKMRANADGHISSIAIGGELKSILKSTQFWLAISAAPVVFCIIIKLTEGMSDTAAFIVAFQNGFFWQKVLPIAEQQTLSLHHSDLAGSDRAPSPTRVNGPQ